MRALEPECSQPTIGDVVAYLRIEVPNTTRVWDPLDRLYGGRWCDAPKHAALEILIEDPRLC